MKKKSLALAFNCVWICFLLGAQCEEPPVEQPSSTHWKWR